MDFKRCDIKGARKWNQYYEITNKYLYKKVSENGSVNSLLRIIIRTVYQQLSLEIIIYVSGND